jgi:hypothetical protein
MRLWMATNWCQIRLSCGHVREYKRQGFGNVQKTWELLHCSQQTSSRKRMPMWSPQFSPVYGMAQPHFSET